jgi:glutamyl-tRNA synthetase
MTQENPIDTTGQVRVRFAPSPTGYLHLGGARTALYNWLWAKKTNGVFVLRIEDTDVERSTQDSVQEILDGLTWLGLDWDEGPFLQTANLDQHVDAAHRLLDTGHAYRCFCTKEELEQQRQEAEARKVAFMYDGRCRKLSNDQVQAKIADRVPFVVRFAVPRDPGARVVFEDLVFGRQEKRCQDIEDFVILRSDGRPLYLLSNAVDDQLDRITHVIRGADGLANTPKQVLIYKALGWTPPTFAHMPLTLDSKKTKLSKRRHGEVVTIAYYRAKGVLPWALCNFMALLGWSSGDTREYFTKEELIEAFDLSRINRANAIFNYVPGDARNWTDPKLIHFNAHYLRTLPLDELLPYVKEELQRTGLWKESYGRDEEKWFRSAVDLMRARFHTIEDFSTTGKFFFADEFSVDQKAVQKNLCKDAHVHMYISQLAPRFEKLSTFDKASTEEAVRSFAAERNVSAGLIINACRTTVSGSAVGPPLFEMLEAIGKERVVNRLKKVDQMIAACSGR